MIEKKIIKNYLNLTRHMSFAHCFQRKTRTAHEGNNKLNKHNNKIWHNQRFGNDDQYQSIFTRTFPNISKSVLAAIRSFFFAIIVAILMIFAAFFGKFLLFIQYGHFCLVADHFGSLFHARILYHTIQALSKQYGILV